MLTIGLFDGTYYNFDDFTDYEITKDLVIVKKDQTWIGVFNRNQFVSLVYNDKITK